MAEAKAYKLLPTSTKDTISLTMTELIRCKDCEYNTGHCRGIYSALCTCYLTGTPHKEDWFCADARRKDDNSNDDG